MVARVIIIMHGIAHTTASILLLCSQLGLYLAFKLVALYFQANTAVKINTGITTISIKSKAVIINSFSSAATLPFGSRMAALQPLKSSIDPTDSRVKKEDLNLLFIVQSFPY
jgi:hypothetical protein